MARTESSQNLQSRSIERKPSKLFGRGCLSLERAMISTSRLIWAAVEEQEGIIVLRFKISQFRACGIYESTLVKFAKVESSSKVEKRPNLWLPLQRNGTGNGGFSNQNPTIRLLKGLVCLLYRKDFVCNDSKKLKYCTCPKEISREAAFEQPCTAR